MNAKWLFYCLWKPISAKTRYILQWMKRVSHDKRCIFQLLRCIIPIWRPPNISGGRQIEIYISPVEIYIFVLEIYISFSKWRQPERKNTSQQLKDTSLTMKNTFHPL